MWIARDKDGELYLFENKPVLDGYVFTKTTGFYEKLSKDLFHEVTFSNSPRQVSLALDMESGLRNRVCFDAEKFVDNETTPVETKNGESVTIYTTERAGLFSVVREINELSQITAWTAMGKYVCETAEHKYDLMFCEKR